MKNKIKYAAISVITLFCVTGHAIADTASNNTVLFDLINQIRVAPFSYALSLGYDAAFLQERNIFPETVLSPYLMDESLNSDAVRDNDNMAGKDTQLLTNESVYLVTAETAGVVSFFNFMPLTAASKIFIENLFKNELENNKFQHILSTQYVYAGTSITSGVTADRMNAWFCTLHLGSSVLTAEIQLLNMINQIRSEPWKIRAYFNKDLTDFFQENISVFNLVGQSFSPLFFDSSLHLAAGFSAINKLPGMQSNPLVANMNLLARSQYFGYQGQSASESTVAIACAKDNFIECINPLFFSLISNELSRWPENSLVFSNEFQDAGPAIAVRSEENLDIAGFSLVGGAGSFGNSQAFSRVYGILFSDTDRNGVYSPGEEFAKENVMVFDQDLNLIRNVVTNNAGQFSLTLDINKKYSFKAETETFSATKEIFVDSDQFVQLVYSPPAS